MYSSNGTSHQPQPKAESEESQQGHKRKTSRSPSRRNSLRKVVIEAQRSRDESLKKPAPLDNQITTKTITAFCAAEKYDMAHADRIINLLGQDKDPYGIDLFPQVVHAQIPVKPANSLNGDSTQTIGDLFVFPSGTVVAWAIPKSMVLKLVKETLYPAARNSYPGELEEEDLEFLEDPNRETSGIKGDTITIGTKLRRSQYDAETTDSQVDGKHSTNNPSTESDISLNRLRDAVLVKVAFSSGLARSTKLAVLESLLQENNASNKSVVDMLSRGGRLPRSRSLILEKTGQLLNIRAQLNLYSELTDSLPDLFWDSRSELELEKYYDHVGRALDINIRVKEFNEKMNYAQEIANVLREALNERHSVRLEWIIIILIAVEIGFNVLHEFRYRHAKGAKKTIEGA